MKKQYMILLNVLLITLVLTSAFAGAECSRKGKTNKTTAAYAAPPYYVTGKGWQGEFVRTLAEKTQLYICECREVEFGFSSKTWCKTAFRPAKDWQYGWVIKEDLDNWPSSGRQEELPRTFSLIREALAAEGKTSPAEEWTLPPPSAISANPPQSAPSANNRVPSSSSETDSTFSFKETIKLYWPLFLSMLLGMGAKAGVDMLYAANKGLAKEHMRNGVVAILISPIVFLGFLNGGSFQASAQTFLVLCLVAFQNGFFWQTVLKRPVAEEKAALTKPQPVSAK